MSKGQKPHILVTKATLPPFEEYIEEIRDIWDSHWLTNMGEKHNELERQLCDRLKVPNISLFCNGHMALELVIQAYRRSDNYSIYLCINNSCDRA